MSLAKFIGPSVVLGALAFLGCSSERPDLVTVKGTVTLDGQPIPSGTISFVSKDGVASTGGGVIANGAYEALTPPGEKWVMALATQVVGQEPMYEGDPNSPMQDIAEQITSPVYNAAHLTPLETKIDGPTEGLNFELTKNAKPR